MQDYSVANPVFHDTIEIPDTSDTNHADNINHAPKEIYENTLVLKQAALAPSYVEGSSYNVGDYISYNGVTYRVTEEIEEGSTWGQIESKVVETNIYKDSGSDGALKEEIVTVANDVDALRNIVNVSCAAAHNAIFRGNYLGDHVTDEQYAAIQAGTFDDMYIGDYWTINGIDWVIADFDYWLGTGDSGYELTGHHILIVPRSMLYYSTYMNASNTTEGGYIGSYMYTTGLTEAKNMVISAFGSDHVVTHREYLTNAVTSGYPSGAEWVDSTVELMNEEMVYGCPIRQQMCFGGTVPTTTTIDKSQLSLFRYDRNAIISYGNGINGGTAGTRYNWWLRDVVSATAFAIVYNRGYAGSYYASGTYGVRPCFAIN